MMNSRPEIEGDMNRRLWFPPLAVFLTSFCVLLAAPRLTAQDSKVMGELKLQGASGLEKDAGVWIDGEYVGYVKELKGNRKVMLTPGEHEISIRQAGYKEFTQKITVEANGVQTVAVVLEEDTKVTYPGSDAAELRLDIRPKRAAVYLDGGYMGHGGDFGGRFHSMVVSPGKHQLKVTLDGYQPYEKEIDALASTKTQMKIDLEVAARH